MIKDRIIAIKAKLAESNTIPPATKTELENLLASLEEEVASLSGSGDTVATANEPDSIDDAMNDLRKSVEGFETSHPQITGIVGRIATTLSNMGI